MKRMLMVVLALSLVAVLALPAFAEVQNIKVTGSVKVRGFYRDSYGTTGSGAGAAFTSSSFTSAYGERDWYNTQTRLGVSADLTDNVAASILLGNERDWGGSTAVKLKNSYITVKEMLYSPLTLKVGKMGVKIADKLLIGDGSIGSNGFMASDYQDGKSFDAIVGILDYDPVKLVLGTLKIGDGASTTSNDDNDIYFINGMYQFEDDMNSSLDVTLANVRWTTPDGAGTTGPDGNSTCGTNLNALAFMLRSEPMEDLSAKLTVGFEKGDYVKTTATSRDLDAMAIDLFLDYALDAEYSPKIGFKYVYRSGEEAGNNGDYEGWLPMYEDQGHGFIYDPNTNISAFALSAKAAPADRLTVYAEYWMYMLAESQTATSTRTADDEAGTELDLKAKYAYTEDVSIALELAWFFPGNYYASGYDETAQQTMLEFGVKF